MKRKGFTLVELLAVIAILAILVIIALPNVMSLFNEAKKNSFTNELKEIYKTAQNQWMTDSMFETNERTYSRVKGSNCPNGLKLSGREELNYIIKVDKAGRVVEYYATDGTYQYTFNGTELKIEEITNVDQITNLSVSEIKVLTCNGVSQPSGTNGLNGTFYAYSLTNISIGDNANNIDIYNTPQEAMNLYSQSYFQKIIIANDIVTSVVIGFRKNGNDYILDPNNYSASSNALVSAFGSSICNAGTILTECSEGQGGLAASVSNNYAIIGEVRGNNHGCMLSDSTSKCE